MELPEVKRASTGGPCGIAMASAGKPGQLAFVISDAETKHSQISPRVASVASVRATQTAFATRICVVWASVSPHCPFCARERRIDDFLITTSDKRPRLTHGHLNRIDCEGSINDAIGPWSPLPSTLIKRYLDTLERGEGTTPSTLVGRLAMEKQLGLV
jgi:hypothetical protein